jgi:protein involved in polysaccharide export with SLBB domain
MIAGGLLAATFFFAASDRKSDAQEGVNASAPATAPAIRPSTRPGTLEPGDLVELSVADLTGAGSIQAKFLRVDKDGMLSPMLVPAIHVGGLTVAEAEDAIAGGYNKAHLLQRAMVGIRRLQLAPPHDPLIEPIQKLDLLRITVWELRGPASEDVCVVRLAPDGSTRLPFIGKQQLLGLSATQAEQSIAKAFHDNGIIQHAMVSVLRLEPAAAGATDLPDVAVGPIPDALRHLFIPNPATSVEMPHHP